MKNIWFNRTTTDAGLLSTWLGVYAGVFNTSGNFGSVGTGGFYWSSTVLSAANARLLLFDSTAVFPALSAVKGNGNSVRCVQ